MLKRTDYCGALTLSDVGRRVTACGWVSTRRDMGGVIFADLRDREGVLQVVFDTGVLPAGDFAAAEGAARRDRRRCVRRHARAQRGHGTMKKSKPGRVELLADCLEVLSQRRRGCRFRRKTARDVRDELRLRYRFLDLRRPEMQHNLRLRHRVARVTAEYLTEHGFTEVETPILTRINARRARGIIWFPRACIPGSFTPCRSRRRFSSSF